MTATVTVIAVGKRRRGRGCADGPVRAGSRHVETLRTTSGRVYCWWQNRRSAWGTSPAFCSESIVTSVISGAWKTRSRNWPARLVARLLEESSALEPDMTLAGEADGDVHGRHKSRLCFGSRR